MKTQNRPLSYADQRVASIRKGSVTESYTYDGYGRVTQKVTTLSGETRLTERYTYRIVDGKPTTQVASHQIISAARDITYSYTYDDNGNILSVTESFVSPGTTQTISTITSYVYDSQNQLLRENNEAAGKSWTWTYDDAGNILSHGEYAYTTGTLGTALDTTAYTYGRTGWGDLLTAYDGTTIYSDEIGNPLASGEPFTSGYRTYTWKNGRQLATLSQNGTTWSYTYNADGLRIGRTNGTTTYQYIYADGQLVKQRIGTSTMSFSYDAAGMPMSVYYSGANYYYVTNLQGDVIAITNDAGAAVVSYTYDAWGKILSITGTMANTLGKNNPLRYRGYVYDRETELYYLQSRYYDPEMGRFISPDAFASTGQGIIGNNMFAYCGNAPVLFSDRSGYRYAEHADVAGGYNKSKAVTKREVTLPKQESSSFMEGLLAHMTRPRNEGTTVSIGVTGGVNSGGQTLGQSKVLSADSSHNYAIQDTSSIGASTGAGGSAGLTFTITNAGNVSDLNGASVSKGATLVAAYGISVDFITFSPASDPDRVCYGVCVVLAAGAEAEVHSADNYTTTSWYGNPLDALRELLYG